MATMRKDPFVAFRFEINLDGLSVAGFSECSGLQWETEVQDYNEGGLNTYVHKFPTRTKQSNLVLKRGIVDRVMWNWYWDLTQGLVQLRTGAVIVHDPSGSQVVMQWEFKDAFPSKWTGPDLNATQNNVAVESMEIVHTGLKRVR
jgi:phage tail-like protein